jgi:phage shock protein PspC (stress-responsive transcriptional regulator)
MKLCRSYDDHQLAGVCGGLAKHFDLPASKLRVVWVLGTLFSAAFPGVLLYLALWYLLPEEPPPVPSFGPAVLQPWKKTS